MQHIQEELFVYKYLCLIYNLHIKKKKIKIKKGKDINHDQSFISRILSNTQQADLKGEAHQ